MSTATADNVQYSERFEVDDDGTRLRPKITATGDAAAIAPVADCAASGLAATIAGAVGSCTVVLRVAGDTRSITVTWEHLPRVASATRQPPDHHLAITVMPPPTLSSVEVALAPLRLPLTADVEAAARARLTDVKAALRAALGAADTPDRLAALAAVLGSACGAWTPAVGPRVSVPAALPQQTFPEARSLATALGDTAALRHWVEVPGGAALYHVIPDSRFQVRFVPSPMLLRSWGASAPPDRLPAALRELRLASVLLLHVAVGLVLEHRQASVALDDLIRAVGWQPRSRAERDAQRRTLWRWLLVLDSLEVHGTRLGHYYDAQARQALDLTCADALIRVTGARADDCIGSESESAPREVTLAAGPWLEKWRGNRRVLTDFGDVRRLAALPGGQAAGAWAQSVGLALQQRWRERAARAAIGHVGTGNRLTARLGTFTRRDLLGLFRAEPDFEEVLAGEHPRRAEGYWRAAIQLLQQSRVVGHYQEVGPPPVGRKGWQAAWLDQALDVRPTADATLAVAAISRRAGAAKRRGAGESHRAHRPPSLATN